MKVFCFNLDECSYIHAIPVEELNEYDLTKPFIKCPQCNSLAIIANDNFNPDHIDQQLLINSIIKLSKRK